MIADIFEGINTEHFARLGFCISFVGTDSNNKDIYQVQRIDEPDAWQNDNGYNFKVPYLESDEEAKLLAQLNGFEFNDTADPLRVTGKK